MLSLTGAAQTELKSTAGSPACTLHTAKLLHGGSSSPQLQTRARFILHLLLLHSQDCGCLSRDIFLTALSLRHGDTEIPPAASFFAGPVPLWELLGGDGSSGDGMLLYQMGSDTASPGVAKVRKRWAPFLPLCCTVDAKVFWTWLFAWMLVLRGC